MCTATTLLDKLEAPLRGLRCGFLPDGLAEPYIGTGNLVAKRVEPSEHLGYVSYAWGKTPTSARGRALPWFDQLEHINTRNALMCRRSGVQG